MATHLIAFVPLLPMLTAAQGEPRPPRTFLQMFQSTGFVGIALLLLGVAGAVVFVRRLLELRAERLAPAQLQKGLERAVRDGQGAAALAQATASNTPLGEMVAAGLHLLPDGLDEMLANTERAAVKESLRLGNRIANLSRLAGLVLLLGVLGTVLGLLSAVAVLGRLQEPGVADLVAGVGEPLTSTAFALVVAIGCFSAFAWLESQLVQRTLAVREIAEELLREAALRASAPSPPPR